jgi:hypothetical protein
MQAVRSPLRGGAAGRHQGLCRYLTAEDTDVSTVVGVAPGEGIGPDGLKIEELEDVGQRFGHATELSRIVVENG